MATMTDILAGASAANGREIVALKVELDALHDEERRREEAEFATLDAKTAALRLARVLSMVQRWERQLLREPDNVALRGAIADIRTATCDLDGRG